jgi:hypothetical protein
VDHFAGFGDHVIHGASGTDFEGCEGVRIVVGGIRGLQQILLKPERKEIAGDQFLPLGPKVSERGLHTLGLSGLRGLSTGDEKIPCPHFRGRGEEFPFLVVNASLEGKCLRVESIDGIFEPAEGEVPPLLILRQPLQKAITVSDDIVKRLLVLM